MAKKEITKEFRDAINTDIIVQRIFKDVYEESHNAEICQKCESVNIENIDNENSIFKCKDCKFTFSPRTNSLFHKIKYSNDKWFKLLTCMVNDYTLEETVKLLQSSADSIKRRWTWIYEELDWDKYNVNVRDKPVKNIYADFEVVIN